MKKLKSISSLFLAATMVLAGCSRHAEKTPLRDAQAVQNLGPSGTDTNLQLAANTARLKKTLYFDEQSMATEDYFRLVDDINTFGKLEDDDSLRSLARSMYGAFYKDGSTYTKTKFEKIYAEAMAGQGELEVQKQLTLIARELSVTKEKLARLFDSSAAQYPWPKEITHLNQALTSTDAYVNWLLGKGIPRLNLKPELSRPVIAAIRTAYLQYRPGFVEMANGLENAKDFEHALGSLKIALQKFKVKLPEEPARVLEHADRISEELSTMESSQDALTLIIDVWRLVPADKRATVFKAAAPELYDALNERSESELDCLSIPICLLNPPLGIVRRIIILPKISEIGVQNIHDKIESAARTYLIKTVHEQAADLLKQIPVQAKTTLVAEAEKYQKLVARIQNDFPGYVKEKTGKWAATEFKQDVRGMETSRVRVKFGGKSDIEVRGLVPSGATVTTGAATLGLSLGLSHEFLPEKGERVRPALLEPIVKMLAIGGFRQTNGKQFPSMMLPLDGQLKEVFRLEDLMRGKTSFAVPDSFTANANFVMDRKTAPKNASVGAQAELLRGLARQIRFHQDWEKNIFDEQLGVIQVEDVATDIPKGAIDYSLFPKDLIFAMALGDAGALVQNVIRDLSPAFILMNDQNVLWGNQYRDISMDKVVKVTGAGLVNIEKGARGKTVRTADIARYVLALDEFLTATADLEKTTAKPLQGAVQKDIQDARGYLKYFQIGLATFLKYATQGKNDPNTGAVNGKYMFSGGKLVKVDSPYTLEDQALAIRALVASSKSLGIRIFESSALDTYYFMNKSMWSPRAQFYSPQFSAKGIDARAPSFHEVIQTLVAVDELAPSMNTESRHQWENIAQPWIHALQDL